MSLHFFVSLQPPFWGDIPFNNNLKHFNMEKFDPATNLERLDKKDAYRGVNPAICDSATFMFEQAKTMTDTFHGETEGYFLYSRHWNPSTLSLAQIKA